MPYVKEVPLWKHLGLKEVDILLQRSSSFHLANKQTKRYLMLELKVNETVKARGSGTKKSQ